MMSKTNLNANFYTLYKTQTHHRIWYKSTIYQEVLKSHPLHTTTTTMWSIQGMGRYWVGVVILLEHILQQLTILCMTCRMITNDQ